MFACQLFDRQGLGVELPLEVAKFVHVWPRSKRSKLTEAGPTRKDRMGACTTSTTTPRRARRPRCSTAMLPVLPRGFGNASSLHRRGSKPRARIEDARESRSPRALGAREGRGRLHERRHRGEQPRAPRRGARAAPAAATTSSPRPSSTRASSSRSGRSRRKASGVSSRRSSPTAASTPTSSSRSSRRRPSSSRSCTSRTRRAPSIRRDDRPRAKAKRPGLVVHSDGVQALGKLAPPSRAVDLYTVSAHKVHGPAGSGGPRDREGRARPAPHRGRRPGARPALRHRERSPRSPASASPPA